jgi:hypothetical protein
MGARKKAEAPAPPPPPTRPAKRAEIIKAELFGIADRTGGRLSPATVLEHARDPKSPLHGEFEWDDSKAGEAFRLVQASALIRSVRIRVISESEDPHRVTLTLQRGIVSLPSLRGSDEGSYIPVTQISDPTELVNEVLAQLERLRKKHATLTQLSGVWRAIDEVVGA